MKMTAMDQIPYQAWQEGEKEQVMETVRTGNKVWIRFYKRVKRVYTGEKRLSRRSFRLRLFKVLRDNKRPVFCGQKLLKSDIAKVKAVMALEWRILTGFSPCIFKKSNNWLKNHQERGWSLGDFYSEATAATIDAIYNYTKPDVKFITYLYLCINNRLAHFINGDNQLSHWTNNSRKLYGEYEQASAKFLQKNGFVSFEAIVKDMGLSNKKAKILSKMLVRVSKDSEIKWTSRHENEDGSFMASVAAPEGPSDSITEMEKKALDAACETEWDRKVLQAFLAASGERGWQTELAATNVNPATGLPYSRRAPAVAMERIQHRAIENLRCMRHQQAA